MPFVFYDTETTGTEPEFDQILQFAAIKTDDNLNEVEEFNIRCRLLPHIIPAPGALLTNRVTPKMLTDLAYPTHYEAIKIIRSKLSEWSPSVFIGYNSMAFDEEILRQAQFQTLHNPYLTNSHGNTRADVMRMAYAASVYASNTITVPINEKGQPTFRLQGIALANGYNSDKAHEALADVKMTIQMFRWIKERAPDVWKSMMASQSKTSVFQQIGKQPTFTLTDRYGRNFHHFLVTTCGMNGNQDAAVFDLQFDPDELLPLSAEELVEVLNGKKKPIRALRANKQPIIMPAGAAPEGTKALALPKVERDRRVKAIQDAKDFQRRVGQAMEMRYDGEKPSEYIEARIYSDGFPSDKDQGRMTAFHDAKKWEDRSTIANQIEDERVKEFAHRLIYFERPEVLPAALRSEIAKWHKEHLLTTDEVPWTTVPKALDEIDEILGEASKEDADFLKEIRPFIAKIADSLG